LADTNVPKSSVNCKYRPKVETSLVEWGGVLVEYCNYSEALYMYIELIRFRNNHTYRYLCYEICLFL